MQYSAALEGRDHALERLRRDVRAGNPNAQAMLAERLLTQPPYDLKEGVTHALAAAADGNGDAAHLVALLSAWGLGLDQDWNAALAHLLVAAQAGHGLDRRVLAALAGEWHLARNPKEGEALSAGDWTQLKARIDLNSWLATPAAEIVSDSPRIAVVRRFLSPEVCNWVIERARPNLVRAKIYNPADGARDDRVRTNTEHHFSTFGSDLILMFAQHRIAKLTALPIEGMEACTALHYDVGEEFLPHHDFFDVSTRENASIVAREGQRVLTFLIYLNEGFAGGETDFPLLKRRYKGHQGDALFFWNIRPDFTPDPRTLHAGLAPARGEKWLLSQWIRGRPPG